MSELD